MKRTRIRIYSYSVLLIAILLSACGGAKQTPPEISSVSEEVSNSNDKEEEIAEEEAVEDIKEEPVEEEALVTEQPEDWEIAYANCLNNIINNVEPLYDSLELFYYDDYREDGVLKSTPYYALLDMSGDDIPELIISAREPDQSWSEYTLYQAEGESYGDPLKGVFAWDRDENIVYCGHDMSTEAYKVADDRIFFIESYVDCDGTWEYQQSEKDPVSISESDYNAYIEKARSLTGSIEVEFIPLTAENVERDFPDTATISENPSSNGLFDDFLAGKINAEGSPYGKGTFNISDLTNADEEWLKFEVSGYVDVDNDGDDELVMAGPYGGMILDVRDDKVYELTEGEGTAGILNIAKLDNDFWIVHQDTSHGGRQLYVLDKYSRNGEIEESTTLGAEYWDSPTDRYDENSVFYFKDKPITMEEFESIRDELFMWQNSDSE